MQAFQMRPREDDAPLFSVVGPRETRSLRKEESEKPGLLINFSDDASLAHVEHRMRTEHLINSGYRIVDAELCINPNASPKVRSWIVYE